MALLLLRLDLLALFFGLLVDGFLHVPGALLFGAHGIERCGNRRRLGDGLGRFVRTSAEGNHTEQDRELLHPVFLACGR